MCRFYHQYKFWNKITAIADNDATKHGKDFYVWWKVVPIISVDRLVEQYRNDNSIILIIMLMHINCFDVVKQLNDIPELKDMDCYIYSMFQFCDTFPQIPDEVLRLRSNVPQIPKVIHYIWVGGYQIPEKHLEWMQSWKKHCPDYEIKLWNEKNYDIGKCRYMLQAYESGMYAYVPDYMRLDILYEHGGIYLDTDVELLKSLDELLYYPAYFGMGRHHSVAPGLGFGSAPGNELIKEMRDVYYDVSFINSDGRANRLNTDIYQTEVLRWHGFSGVNGFHAVKDAAIFPTEYFCPKSTVFGIVRITDNCHSIHHFEVSGCEQEYRKIIGESQGYFELI